MTELYQIIYRRQLEVRGFLSCLFSVYELRNRGERSSPHVKGGMIMCSRMPTLLETAHSEARLIGKWEFEDVKNGHVMSWNVNGYGDI